MGRRPRLLVEGEVYQFNNRVSRGEHTFRDEAEPEKLLNLPAETKRRDGFQVFAWCVVSSHDHLAARMGEVALSRSMRTLKHRYAQSVNGRHRVFGPYWQGRYRSKLVEDGDCLQQLDLYIHLNPVAAGVVKDPSEYRWSGHTEVLRGRRGRGLVDIDETLAVFEPTRRAAVSKTSTTVPGTFTFAAELGVTRPKLELSLRRLDEELRRAGVATRQAGGRPTDNLKNSLAEPG